MRRLICGLLVTVLLLSTAVIAAQTTEDLQQQITQLQAQLNSLHDKLKQREDHYAHQGFYVEGSAGETAQLLLFSATSSSSGTSTNTNSRFMGPAGMLAVGYRPHLNGYAIEGGVGYSPVSMQFCVAKCDYNDAVTGTGTLPLSMMYIAARWQHHFTPRFSWITKTGIWNIHLGRVDTVNVDGQSHTIEPKDKPTLQSMTLPFVGIGLSYDMTPKLAFSVQYQGAIYAIANLGELTTGLTYNLG